MEWKEKIEVPVKITGEPGEEQVRELLQRASYVSIKRDGLGNWMGALMDHQGWEIERLFYQNADPGDTNHDDDGPISLCRSWGPLSPKENQADMRVSQEWGSLAVGVLHDIAACARQVLEQELAKCWQQEHVSQYSVLVASTASGPCRSLFDVARDDPVVLPILRDKIKEELP